MAILTLSASSEFRPASSTMSKYRSAESQTLLWERNEKFDGTSRLVIACHGHGADSSQFGQNYGPGSGPLALVRTGRYIVLSIDAGGPAEWGNNNSMSAITDAVTWARAHGARAGRYGLLGWSMGGWVCLNRIRQDAANVAGAWLWVPATDADYFAMKAGYVPSYAPASTITGWRDEINTAYTAQGGYAGSNPFEFAAYANLNVPTYLALASDDTTIPPGMADVWLSNVNNPSFFQSPKGKVTGNHTGLFDKFTDAEIVAHYDSLTW